MGGGGGEDARAADVSGCDRRGEDTVSRDKPESGRRFPFPATGGVATDGKARGLVTARSGVDATARIKTRSRAFPGVTGAWAACLKSKRPHVSPTPKAIAYTVHFASRIAVLSRSSMIQGIPTASTV